MVFHPQRNVSYFNEKTKFYRLTKKKVSGLTKMYKPVLLPLMCRKIFSDALLGVSFYIMFKIFSSGKSLTIRYF